MSVGAVAQWLQQEEIENRGRVLREDPGQNDNRFIWQGAEDILHAEVHSQVIERCRTTPITKLLRWENYTALASEQRIPGLERKDRDGKIAEAMYATAPGPIFDGIIEQYEVLGVIELEALRGMGGQHIQALSIDTTFFPERKDPNTKPKIDETPRTYREMKARIYEIVDKIEKGQHASPKNQWPIYLEVAKAMIRSLAISEHNDHQRIDLSESEIELGKINPQYKQRYDNPDYRALHRLERQRKDHVTTHLADQQKDLIAAIATRHGDATLTPDMIRALVQETVKGLAELQKGPGK
jgi:hypothetical protein